MDSKKVAIFGSTGSIGKTTLEVILQDPRLKVAALFAGGSSIDTFVKQVNDFKPEYAGLANLESSKVAYSALKSSYRGKWLSPEEIKDYAANGSYDIQLAAVIGVEGLQFTLPAFLNNKTIALANKESLVVGGHFFKSHFQNNSKNNAAITDQLIPVDSEHSSIFRLLNGINKNEVKQIVLTASGGPFLNKSKQELANVTVSEALNHPTWQMGPRISLDSATMINKAFEVIEARWLFDLNNPNQIDVVVHPQSIVHGILRLNDDTEIFHAAPPSMSYPVSYALTYPEPSMLKPINNRLLASHLEFLTLDTERFPAVSLAKKAFNEGTGFSLRLYLANEVAAQAFFDRKLKFLNILPFIQFALEAFPLNNNVSFADISLLIEDERGKLREVLSSFRED